MKAPPSRIACVAAALGIAGLGFSGAARATVISGNSAAFGLYSNVLASVLGLNVPVAIAQTPSVSGAAPAPYSKSATALNATLAPLVTTGVLTAQAQSGVNGLNGPRSSSATSTVNDLAIAVLGGLSAAEVLSNAGVSGNYGALTLSGGTSIVGLALAGIPILDLSPAPNTVLFNALGLTITLNQQILTGNGKNNESLEVRGIDISLNNVAGILNGNVIIADSFAHEVAVPEHSNLGPIVRPDFVVPEPASFSLLGAGLIGLSVVRRKRS